MDQERINFFEKKVLPILHYVGAIGAGVMCIAYVLMIFVLINGFKVDKSMSLTVFAVVNAGVGFVIMQFLKYQGTTFASLIPENEKIMKDYHAKRTKDKKNHSLTYYWITSVVKDIIIKCVTVASTSIGIIYIVVKGNHDYNLLLLALVNLLMFISFGFLSLVKAYNYYNNVYISYVKEKLQEVE